MNDVDEDERINKIRQSAIGHEAAAFASYDGVAGRLSYNANMRVQYNSMNVTTNGLEDNRGYWSLCPSAVLKYYLDKKQKHSIALTYNRNVYGIPYAGVSTYRVYDGANHYSMGNPDIDIPASQWINMEITLFKSLHLNFSYTKNEKACSTRRRQTRTIRTLHALCCKTARKMTRSRFRWNGENILRITSM